MINLKVGDTILDISMSERLGVEIRPTITKIDNSAGKITCNHFNHSNAYPHSFYVFEKNISWAI